MSSKGSRGARVAQKTKQTLRQAPDEVSSISSFLEGLQSNHGHPLHSTALEEDLVQAPQTSKESRSRRRGAATKRKEEEEERTGKKRRRRRSVTAESNTSPEQQQSEKLSSSQTPDSNQTRTLVSSRKSSSPGGESRRAQQGAAVKKRTRHKARTELHVILDAFLHFSNEYRDSVRCEDLRRSIGMFSSSVKEQLVEQTSSYQELSALKRDNSKNASQTRLKSKSLLEAKYELLRAQRKQQQLHKQKEALRLRLADLQQGSAFLQDIRGLQGRYLDLRRGRPEEEETYGASSLAALTLEAQLVHSAQQQLSTINARLEKRVEQEGK